MIDRKAAYAEKLLDPRWQKKRRRILKRDKFSCRRCLIGPGPYHVHHRWYRGEPWEAPDYALETLCEVCHEEETANRAAAERCLLAAFKGFSAGELDSIAETFDKLFKDDLIPEIHDHEYYVPNLIRHAFWNPSVREWIAESFFAKLAAIYGVKITVLKRQSVELVT